MNNPRLTFLIVLLCASMTGLAMQYCQIATGHQNDANFGDAAGRILLSLEPTGNTDEYRLTIRPNMENGNTKQLDYLYVTGNNGLTISPNPSTTDIEESGIGSDELSITFSCRAETADLTVMWSYPDWAGRFQCTVSDIVLSELETCNSTPAQIVYFINAAQWGGVRVVVQTWDESTENWVVSSRGEATLTTEQVNGYDIYSYTLPEGFTRYGLAFQDTQNSDPSHTTTSTTWPEGNPYFCVNGMYDDGMGYALGDWYASLEEYMEAAANAQYKHLHIDDLYYNLNPDNQTAEVTYDMFGSSNNYSGLAGTVIPATIEYESVTYSVTSIGEQAFAYCSALSSIDIPSTVTSIGKQAFGWCLGLTSITIPNSITNIEDEAFLICSSLMTIFVDAENQIYDSRENCNAIIETSTNTLILGCQNTIIPNGVTSLGENAFSSCNGLKNITIPSSVTTIGNNALSWCELLESITCFAATPPTSNQTVFEGIDFSIPVYVPMESIELYQAAEGWGSFTNIQAIKEQQEINNPVLIGDLYYNLDADNQTAEVTANPDGESKYTGDITIPASVSYNGITFAVTSIGDDAFGHCSDMTSIKIPSSVTTIGVRSFSWCTSLTSVEIPNSVSSIGNYAFSNCTGMSSVTLSNILPNIGGGIFSGCSALASIDIPNSVTSINEVAFEYCSSLAAVTFHANITKIGFSAFYSCSALTSVEIPQNISSIGSGAFRTCVKLTAITVASDNANYSSEDGILFDKEKTELLQYPAGKDGAYTIPNSVTKIIAQAFEGCAALTNIVIPNGVTDIGFNAFCDCSGLTSITCEATTPPTCGGSVFENVNTSAITLYVPAQSIEAYQAADQWKEFNIQAIAGVNPQVNALMVTDVCQGEAMTTVTYATSDATTYQYYIVGQTPLSEVMPVSERGTFILDISAFAAGQYTLKFVASSESYASDTATATFTIYPLPAIAITSVEDQCYPAATIDVAYKSTNASTISYSVIGMAGEVMMAQNSMVVSGDGMFIIDAFYLTPGTYTLEVSAQNEYGCESDITTTTFNILPKPTLSIASIASTCEGEATISVAYTSINATEYTYEIVGTSIAGRGAIMASGALNIDISSLAAGAYTLRMSASSDVCMGEYVEESFTIHPLPRIAITSVSDQCYPAYTIVVNYVSTEASTVSYLVKRGGEVVSATDRVNAQSTGTFMLDATALPPGIYTIEATAQSPYGCESTLATASFNILAPAEHIEESITTCAGESFMWRGMALTEAGIYSDTVRNYLGCDSAIYTLRLTVSIPIEYDAENVTICSGATYIWRDMVLTEAGEYESTLVSIYGCDSIRFRLALTIIEPVEHETDYLTITLGEMLEWRGQQIVGSETGEFTYFDTLYSESNCPTDIYTLQLTVEEKPEEQPTISIFGEEVVITDSTGVEMDQVDILGDSTMIYTPEDNTLTLDNVDLTVGEDVSTAISYTGSQPLIIVLCNFSVIYADTVISSTASIIITGDGQLSVEGTVPIFGLPTASITFNSVNMHARSVPGAQALRRRIRSGRMLDETGGPALSGFGSADFNKTNVSPSGALYGPVNIPDGNGGLTATNALYIVNGNGEQKVLTEFYLTAVEGTGVEDIREYRALDPAQPMYNILGLQVDASYRGIVIQNGKSFLLLGQ